MSPRLSYTSDTRKMRWFGFHIEGFGRGSNNPTKSFRRGMKKGSEGLKSLGRTLRFSGTKGVFAEDLKVTEKKIFDPQDPFLLRMNRLFVISCILSVSVDPLFFYLPVYDEDSNCLNIDRRLAYTSTTLRTLIDSFYLLRMALQFRTAYIAPSSRVFGRGELVIDPAQIAYRYLRRFFIVDFLAVLPLPQIVVWRFLQRSEGYDVLATKNILLFLILLQYIPRFFRTFPLTSELKRTAGVFAETVWAGAAYYLLWYLLASHIVGAFWYLLSVERQDDCWHLACSKHDGCLWDFLYCSEHHLEGFGQWSNVSSRILKNQCSVDDDNPPFNFGIFTQAVTSGIITSNKFFSKFCYCLWFGLQNLSWVDLGCDQVGFMEVPIYVPFFFSPFRHPPPKAALPVTIFFVVLLRFSSPIPMDHTLGQGLITSTYPGEVVFSIALAILGLILFALLIGNMQTYLQSLTIRLEEMRIKRRDSEQWMHHRLLPQELRERVRQYDQYKWLETRGVDEENLVQSLPKDLRRDIKRHLCLALVRRVPLFEKMDERLLDAICERLKVSLCTESTYIVREGDPVDEMLFIIRGRLESVTTDGGRSGFFNRSILKEGDFCGEELLTWALDPKAGANLPSSTRTVKALTEVEAFALIADELKFVASQFRRLHSRQVQHTFRFYSQQWRTWAACFIQAAWRRYCKRKLAELRRREEEGELEDYQGGATPSFAATIYASRFAANALRGVQKLRNKSGREIIKLPKPAEPDFSIDD
ncbi:putative cyclic nucleotide-gated ion channel 5 [Apostasia shenzhenica]|uniref:Putative cyclic nucleotide-gated ion channel 5 n=1 Tax=Apostasia shenzhenica TaxID=1088818 RepID=A0A2I0A5R3_9ASPA|nr:putative cyclic nucleotide-gated ion channel 5 [Apostasia shenzhenica]